ncbi:MAG: hypothetical protein R2712_16495 [Vicinamibacterales bacterium]
MSVARFTAALVAGVLVAQVGGRAQRAPGLQDAAWAPDGRRVAVSYMDRIWTMGPDGRQPRPLARSDSGALEREPAWSPDGGRLAYAANRGDGFDIVVADARTGASAVVAAMPGDERWPSWAPDGRIVFAHREAPPSGRDADASRQWDLYVTAPVDGSDAWQAPEKLTDTADSETFPRVSPDGHRVAFVSERDAEDDVDVWWMAMPSASLARPVPLGARPARTERSTASIPAVDAGPPRPVRLVRARGAEMYLSWAPDSQRVAFYAVRDGIGTVWVATVDPPRPQGDAEPVPRAKPPAPPLLVSRRGGAPAWSPDGRTLLVTGLPDPQPVYNGNPERSAAEAPPLFALNAAFHLWRVPAPEPVHEAGGEITADLPLSTEMLTRTFDRVWDTLRERTTTRAIRWPSGPGRATRIVPAPSRRGPRRPSRPSSTRWWPRSRSSSRWSPRGAAWSCRAIRWRRKRAARPSRRAATSSTR